MSVTAKPLVASGYAASSESTIYTATNVRTIIDKFTVFNSDTAAITYVVKLVPSGSSAASSHTVVTRAISPNETYTLPEVVGHVLENGGFISELASTASKLVRRVSGREVT